MKRIKLFAVLLFAAVLGGAVLAPAASVSALDPLENVCSGNSDNVVCKDENKNAKGEDLIKDLINVLLYVVGALAVVMIIVSGIFYVISSGDAGRVAKAKNTLLYSIVGLVVAFLAFAIVNWVLGEF